MDAPLRVRFLLVQKGMCLMSPSHLEVAPVAMEQIRSPASPFMMPQHNGCTVQLSIVPGPMALYLSARSCKRLCFRESFLDAFRYFIWNAVGRSVLAGTAIDDGYALEDSMWHPELPNNRRGLPLTILVRVAVRTN